MTDIEKLEKKAARWIEEQALLQSGDTVLCALSGGPDSVALFHALRRLAPALGVELRAAHLNHGLRGAEADRDEAFVRRLCARWSVPLFVERAGMALRPAPGRQSEETFARALRYDFFERAAAAAPGAGLRAGKGCDRPAPPATTPRRFCSAWQRGTSLTGAGGIPPRRGRYIRPLLDCTRAEVLAYCAAGGWGYMIDSTNLAPCCSRNRLRLQAVPALREVNPDADAALSPLPRTRGRRRPFWRGWPGSCWPRRLSGRAFGRRSWPARRGRCAARRWRCCWLSGAWRGGSRWRRRPLSPAVQKRRHSWARASLPGAAAASFILRGTLPCPRRGGRSPLPRTDCAAGRADRGRSGTRV